MSTDVFGDLREWKRVLEHLEHLKNGGQLDDHQEGLARLLGRLRETINEHHPGDFQRAVKRVIDCAQQHEHVTASF